MRNARRSSPQPIAAVLDLEPPAALTESELHELAARIGTQPALAALALAITQLAAEVAHLSQTIKEAECRSTAKGDTSQETH
jgi:hypothetical protein